MHPIGMMMTNDDDDNRHYFWDNNRNTTVTTMRHLNILQTHSLAIGSASNDIIKKACFQRKDGMNRQPQEIGFQWTVHQKSEWGEMFKKLKAYQQEHNGDCNVPRRYRRDPTLGRWVHWQRNRYKRGMLTKERHDRLESIGFQLTVREQSGWTEMFKRLQAYQQGPRGYRPDPHLGTWVSRQRHLYKKGLLLKERLDKLEEIGFQWTVLERTEWTEMFKRLQTYQREHNGSCNVPEQYHPDPQLGNWVQNQRKNHKKGSLLKERHDQLQAVGFQWTPKREREHSLQEQEQWNEMFKRLQAYKQENNGSCNVPRGYQQDPQLSVWVGNQRQNYKKGLLNKERCDQLEAVGFQQTKWTEMFERLQAYQQGHNGSCNVPRGYRPDPHLGTWVSR